MEALKKRGVRAGAVYSRVVSIPGGAEIRRRHRVGENADTLARFKRGELDVLINVQMLTEGTDVPDAQTRLPDAADHQRDPAQADGRPRVARTEVPRHG